MFHLLFMPPCKLPSESLTKFVAVIRSSWSCSQCTYLNSEGHSCGVCSGPRHYVQSPTNPSPTNPHVLQDVNKSETTWSCEACTFENHSDSLKCSMCNTARPLETPLSLPIAGGGKRETSLRNLHPLASARTPILPPRSRPDAGTLRAYPRMRVLVGTLITETASRQSTLSFAPARAPGPVKFPAPAPATLQGEK
jgi:hypothetical protein